jgi:hypothetical protein
MKMNAIDWDQVDFTEFELIALCLVEAMGFDRPRLISGPGDQGVDLIAFQPQYPQGIPLHDRKWIFQCKKVRTLRKIDITEELANFASQRIDTWVLVTSCSPSPAFQRWFQALEQAQRYPFHIEAWWKNDVEHLVRTHGDYLKKSLPDRLIPLLNLKADSVDAAVSYEAVVAKLRLLADSQIERFARGKYIPKLYVRRELEQDLSKFLLSDSNLVRIAKSSIINTTESAIMQLEDYPSKFGRKTIQIEKELAALRKQRVKIKDREEIDKRVAEKDEQLRRRLEIKGAARELISDLLGSLRSLLAAAGTLPDESYFKHRTTYEDHFQSCRSFVSFLESKLRSLPSPESSAPDLDGISSREFPPVFRGQDIEMLSDDRFIFNYKDKFDSEISNIESSLRSTLVIVDRAGGGKTNLICDLVKSLSAEQPVVLLFGKANLQETDALTKATTESMAKAFGYFAEDAADAFDHLLEAEDQFLTVFIDGINENRRLSDLDAHIESFLEWASHRRIRIIMTCRDIYWIFFNFDSWSHNVYKIVREKLTQFSSTEYGFALPLYLEHYNINCNLAETAKEACHHPLLLRFFCEAYGSIEGPVVSLGNVYDIRLKELFDVYLQRKTEQIRKSMSHRNADLVYRYLLNLVAFLFKNLTTAISTVELEEATGDADTSTQKSLYLHLLDEDIIIEEQPIDELNTRRVGFVYEEFMEYLLASSILKFSSRFGVSGVEEIFNVLSLSLDNWVNARGVGEYVALMLLAREYEYSRADAIKFLGMMVRSGRTWSEAFWSVVGKCSESHLNSDLFDEFYFAIDTLTNAKTIEKTLTAMSRYDLASSHELASIILWSAALPKMVSWSELNTLSDMNEVEFESLTKRLCSALAARKFLKPPGKLSHKTIIESVLPFLQAEARIKIEEMIRKYGLAVEQVGGRAFLFTFWKYFPAQDNFLINGLFSSDESVRLFCADRLRFTKRSNKEMSSLCLNLATAEPKTEVRRILLRSAHVLQRRVEKSARANR